MPSWDLKYHTASCLGSIGIRTGIFGKSSEWQRRPSPRDFVLSGLQLEFTAATISVPESNGAVLPSVGFLPLTDLHISCFLHNESLCTLAQTEKEGLLNLSVTAF